MSIEYIQDSLGAKLYTIEVVLPHDLYETIRTTDWRATLRALPEQPIAYEVRRISDGLVIRRFPR